MGKDMANEQRSLVRCDGCGRSYIMNTTANGKEYLVGLPGDACTDCGETDFSAVTPGSLDMRETPARG